MSQIMNTQHYDSIFNGKDLDALEEALDALNNDDVMTLAEIDGYLAAIHCSPEPIPPSAYLPKIWGEDFEFASEEQVRALMGPLTVLQNNVGARLREDDCFFPIAHHEDGSAELWCQGFLAGTRFYGDDFSALMADEDHGGVTLAICALAYENDEDISLRPYQEPIDDEKRQLLFAHLCAGVTKMYQYFRTDQESFYKEFPRKPVQRETPKVGRNDPCPCGSQQKFKKCCGR